MPTVAGHYYTLAGNGGQRCDPVSTAVTNIDDCRAAADTLGFTNGIIKSGGNYGSDRPYGCFADVKTKVVYYNNAGANVKDPKIWGHVTGVCFE